MEGRGARVKDTPRFEAYAAGIYGSGEGVLAAQRERYERLAGRFGRKFKTDEKGLVFFSAPGRTEISGNHTDHNNGKVMAAAVNLDTVACVKKRPDSLIVVDSEGYPTITVDLNDLEIRPKEFGTTLAIIRGTAALLREQGFKTGGFGACVTSNVLRGSGLSSSAAFEVLMISIFDGLYNGFGMDPVQRAILAQKVENTYFGKPCGLMDQMASSMGGMVSIDFKGNQVQAERIDYDFESRGYLLCVVNTGGSHGDLTDDYAAIRVEMEKAASLFGACCLREVDEARFEKAIPEVRKAAGDRAVLRALHFFDENRRVEKQAEALKKDDLAEFFRLVNESGDSSWKLLQNVYARPQEAQMALGIEMSRRFLGGRGAQRVHGGGFAGTIQAYIPTTALTDYRRLMESIFGPGCCSALKVRPCGPRMVK